MLKCFWNGGWKSRAFCPTNIHFAGKLLLHIFKLMCLKKFNAYHFRQILPLRKDLENICQACKLFVKIYILYLES